jgi:hypothetical protein
MIQHPCPTLFCLNLAPEGHDLCDACRANLKRRAEHLANKRVFDIWWQRDGTAVPREPTITYTITPDRFSLDIPVEALANLTNDGQTRLLDMLNAWILRHKPPVVKS